MTALISSINDGSFYEKYKKAVWVSIGIAVIICIVMLILWGVGIFDSNVSHSYKLVIDSHAAFSGIASSVTTKYINDDITYTINWSRGSLQYKDSEGVRSDLFVPQHKFLESATFHKLPENITFDAALYGPYITTTPVTIKVEQKNNSRDIFYPDGSIFKLLVDNQQKFNIFFMLSDEYEAAILQAGNATSLIQITL